MDYNKEELYNLQAKELVKLCLLCKDDEFFISDFSHLMSTYEGYLVDKNMIEELCNKILNDIDLSLIEIAITRYLLVYCSGYSKQFDRE